MACGSLLLVGATARSLKLPHPNIASLFLMTSSLFFVSSAAGFQDAGGCFFLALFLWSYFSGKYSLAGIILGTLPFIRNELAIIVILFFVWDIWKRKDVKFVAFFALFPLIFWISGSLYHQDLFWLIRYVTSLQSMPSAISYHVPSIPEEFNYLGRSLLLNSPILLLLGFLGAPYKNKLLQFLISGQLITIILLIMFQVFSFFWVDASLRYVISTLPLGALVCTFGLGNSDNRKRLWYVSLVAVSIVWLLLINNIIATIALFSLFLIIAILIKHNAFNEARMTVLITSIILMLFQLFEIGISTNYLSSGYTSCKQIDVILQKHSFDHYDRVYTDICEARFYPFYSNKLQQHYFMSNEGTAWELGHSVNHANNQYPDLIKALEQQRFLMFPKDHRVRKGAVYIFRDTWRTSQWRAHLKAAGLRKKVINKHIVYY
jgi:hypothetical protein